MDCIRKCRDRRNRKAPGLKELALLSLSIARGHVDVREQKIEDELEKEIQRDNEEHRTTISKIRHFGEKYLEHKVALLIIVALNVIDCVLVLSELIVEINYVVGILRTTEETSANFVDSMKSVNNNTLQHVNSIEYIYKKLLKATIRWDVTANLNHTVYGSPDLITDTLSNGTSLSATIPNFASVDDFKNEHVAEEIIAHGFHKVSVAILSVLVLETFVKVFCMGTRILEKKVEVFDGIVTILSYVLDLVFIRGLTMFEIQDYILMLAALVPLRVVRVVNSLIVAVLDHNHSKLKMLYSQKKEMVVDLKQEKKECKAMQRGLETLLNMCSAEGVDESSLKYTLAVLEKYKKKHFKRFSLGNTSLMESNRRKKSKGSFDAGQTSLTNQNGRKCSVAGSVKSDNIVQSSGHNQTEPIENNQLNGVNKIKQVLNGNHKSGSKCNATGSLTPDDIVQSNGINQTKPNGNIHNNIQNIIPEKNNHDLNSGEEPSDDVNQSTPFLQKNIE